MKKAKNRHCVHELSKSKENLDLISERKELHTWDGKIRRDQIVCPCRNVRKSQENLLRIYVCKDLQVLQKECKGMQSEGPESTRGKQTAVVENLKGKHLVIQFKFKADKKASERCNRQCSGRGKKTHGDFLKVCLHSVFFAHASANLRLAMPGTARHG